jgi:hypothetical protein
MKFCKKCLTVKLLTQFNKRKDSKDGLMSICRICQSKKTYEKRGLVFIDYSLVNQGNKICKECKQEKNKNLFHKGKKTNICNNCRNDKIIKKTKIVVHNKICAKCNNSKKVSCFYKCNYFKDSYSQICKECKKENTKSLSYDSISTIEKECKSCGIIKNSGDMVSNRRIKTGISSICKMCNNIKSKIWKENNKEKHKNYNRNRLNSNIIFLLSDRVRKNIQSSFKRACGGKVSKNSATVDILGCSLLDFLEHLQSLFTKGMTLENHGNCEECWHLDHKIPISSAKTEEDVYKLNHYTNFQPLWRFDNLSKGKKY